MAYNISSSQLDRCKENLFAGGKTIGQNKILSDMNLFSYNDFNSVLSWSIYYFRNIYHYKHDSKTSDLE